MNKEKIIKELSKKINLGEKEAIIVNDILEDNFLIGKKNKDKIIESIKGKLNLDDKKANEIYIAAADILKDSLKDKLKHPFKSLD